jgi:hypothetical protein
MFCRHCGKELSEKAVACIGCGMNPRDGMEHCPACGGKTRDKQLICTTCGASLDGGNSDGWSAGAYAGLLVLSFVIPIFGWIYGGIQANKAAPGSKRKSQAWHFVFSGIAGLVFNLIAIAAG